MVQIKILIMKLFKFSPKCPEEHFIAPSEWHYRDHFSCKYHWMVGFFIESVVRMIIHTHSGIQCFQFEQQKHVRCAFFGKSLSLNALSECALCQFVVHNITSLNCALRPSILGKVRLHNYVLIHLTIAKCSVLTGLLITSHKSFYLSTNIAHDRQ